MKRQAENLWKNRKVHTVIVSPEHIVDFLKDRLRWYLEIFSPGKKIIGKTLNEKIERYCNTHISFGVKDILRRVARKKVPKQKSLFEEHTQKGGGKTALIDSLKAKSAAAGSAQKNFSPQKILVALTAKGLYPNQRALVLARIAGMQHQFIARILGVAESRAAQLVSSIQQEHGLPVINLKRFFAVRESYRRRRK